MLASLHTANRNASLNVCSLRHDYAEACVHRAHMDSEDRNFLKAWRLYRRKTQDELAEAVGTTKAVISLLENEKRPLSSKWLRKLAVALDTQPGHILDHDPEHVPAEIYDLWSHMNLDDRQQAARILRTFDRTGSDK